MRLLIGLPAAVLLSSVLLAPVAPAVTVATHQVTAQVDAVSVEGTVAPRVHDASTGRVASLVSTDAETTLLTADSTRVDPDPEAETGRLALVLIPLLVAAVVVIGAVFVIARGRRRRRGD
ncbi:hypothetical protein [uncultured Microbacterium sp.]|uniref:hypothetical protein n=1 Tax=uncultured Microbacterium sp. TaxID=191216 RepID=UPI0025D4E27A|nr:hypothetical protein [uncultured Microbacterium sp.]